MLGKYTKYGIFGAVAGVATPWVLKMISMILSYLPGLEVDLQSLSVTGNIGGALGLGLGDYVRQIFGYLPLEITLPGMLYTAAGGALFVMLGAWVVDSWKTLQFARTKTGKLATIMVVAGLVTGLVMNWSLGIFSIPIIITMIIDALVLSWIWVMLTKKTKMELIP